MKHVFIHKTGAPRLIVIFAGWGMDERPFSGLCRPGYDIMVVYDYRTLDFSPAWTAGYEEICVLAWSMGVQAAQICHNLMGNNVTGRIAVGGTPTPVSDTEGIPKAIFEATLATLDEQSLARFMRRMCGGAGAFNDFHPRMPHRKVEELRDELQAIGNRAEHGPLAAPPFDHYVLTGRDAIFPPGNQRSAYLRNCDIVEKDYPHLPDFKAILNEYFIDKQLVTERFDSAKDTYDKNAGAQTIIADYLASLLGDTDTIAILRNPAAKVLEIGCGTGLLSQRIQALGPAADMSYMDIASAPPSCVAPEAYHSADAENAVRDIPDKSLDMIVSASTMQWFNSPRRFVEECMRALRPGGILALSTFSRDNLPEIATASGVGLHLADAEYWRKAAALVPDTETVLIEHKTIQCLFDSPLDAFRSLSRTGVNAIAREGSGARTVITRLRPNANGKYTLSYKPLFLLLRKKK